MTELEQLRNDLGAVRVQVKHARNVLRTLLPMLAGLQERLDALDNAQPGGTANGNSSEGTAAVRAAA